MEWYYQHQGSSHGPVSTEELERLAEAGEINDETPVWAEGMTAWNRYSSVRGVRVGAVQPVEFGEAEPAVPLVACSRCGRAVVADQTFTLHGLVVCTTCKPLFLQRLKEGAAVPGSLDLAGIGARAGARIIDQIILGIVNMLMMAPLFVLMFESEGEAAVFAAGLFWVVWLAQIAVTAAYEIVFLARRGATPGKIVCGIKVVQSDGGALTWGRATGRHFGHMLTGFTFFIGYLIAFFDQERRALHDMICDTRVVRAS